MIVDVYDLTSILCCSRYQVDADKCAYTLVGRKRLSDVLIYPDSSINRNQPPYLQELKQPILRDLIDESGGFDYSNCSILSDFFQMESQDINKIEAFFRALRYSSYVFEEESDRNVILIPDNFEASLQEIILRTCSLSRECTSLLWRSVAICLGNNSLLNQASSTTSNVKIIDRQQRYLDECIMTINKEGEDVVPQRKAYKEGSQNYPLHAEYNGQDLCNPINSFYRYTYYGNIDYTNSGSTADCVVWNDTNCQFERREFSTQRRRRCAIEIRGQKIEVNPHSPSDGAALYIARKESGRPTYYDECTGLYIIVQDWGKETIFAKELIPPNTKCPGGKEITGTINTDCFIDKGTDNVRFHLTDAYGDDVPLKVLDYNFRTGIMKKREPLKLYPSMIPGQGIARVQVTGTAQLTEVVDLDLLTMRLATPLETVNSLRENIKHSFPVDIPAIAASRNLWNNVQNDVNLYLHNRRYRNKDIFKQWRYADSNAKGMERLNRIHVFGYATNRSLPIYSGSFDFDHLFSYMAQDYSYCKRRGDEEGVNTVLSMISRTYQGHNPVFSHIKRDILKQVEESSKDENAPISPHVMTACAYLLRTPAELQQYFRFYLRKIRKVTGSYKYSGMMHWDRALAELLIANSEMLKYISTEDCNSCLKNQMILLSSYTDYYEPKYKLAYGVLKVCLFLLMRRKYDKSFLAEGCEVRKKVEKRLNRAIRSNDQKVSGWSTILLQFIQGNGMIKDLPNVL